MTHSLAPPATAAGTHPVRARRIRRAGQVDPISQVVTPSDALWRFSVISPLLHAVSAEGSLRQRLRQAASQQWIDPTGQIRSIPAETLRH